MTRPSVQGRCMACGGGSLFLADSGYITCSRSDCPDPGAVSDWLERPPHHVVRLSDSGMSLQHPVTCFPDLTDCEVHEHLLVWEDAVTWPGMWNGLYRVIERSNGRLELKPDLTRYSPTTTGIDLQQIESNYE